MRRVVRAGLRQMVAQIPDFPDRYNPEDQHAVTPPPNPENGPTRPKYRRVEQEANSDEEPENQPPSQIPIPQQQIHQNFQNGRARLDSNIDELVPPPADPNATASASSSLLSSQISEADNIPVPRAGLIRLGPGGRRPRRVKRIVRNPFLDDEAEEASEVEEELGIAASSSSCTRPKSRSELSPEPDSDSELDDSFIVGDDCFE